MTQRLVSTSARRSGQLLLVAAAIALLTGLLPWTSPLARAATHTVNCTNASGDIAAVQSAVNGAGNGDTVFLSGICNFSGADPHGGDQTSIGHTAVLIRPGSAVTNLTITSANGPQQAKVVGSGSQTAFAIAPGNDGTSIKGLIFENLARPIVVLGADDVVIGSQGPTPNINGNRIIGSTFMNSAILAVGSSDSLTVSYGTALAGGSTALTPGPLRDLRVEGNYVSYAPPGNGGPAHDVVAIDVRQKGTALVNRVTITHNAVGQFTNDFASFSQNSIRVLGHTGVAASPTPAMGDYRIRNVDIVANNLGRLEELDPANVPSGVNPADAHAGGRAAVVVGRVGGYTIADNDIRARMSVTGPTGMPGGGIVSGDSSFGTIARNRILSVSDVGTDAARDLGAIGVVDGLAGLIGLGSGDQASYENAVHDNVIAKGFVARRGIVLTGTDKATVFENDIFRTEAAAIHVGADVQGPAATVLSTEIDRSVVCDNVLWPNDPTKGPTLDDPAEVAHHPNAASNGNAFPGGDHPTVPGDNRVCTPSLTVSPAPPDPVNTGDTLVASGRAWAARTVEVRVADDLGASVTKSTTGDNLGTYTVGFTSAELSGLTDGLLTVTATGLDPAGAARTSDPKAALLDLQPNPPGAGQVAIDDGGDGYTNNWEALAGAPVTWTAPTSGPSPAQRATVTWTDGAGVKPATASCGPWTNLEPSGVIRLQVECAAALPQGTYRAQVVWYGTDGEASPVVYDTSILDTRTVVPVITTPTESSTLTTNNVTVGGTAEANATVIITTSEGMEVGQATAGGAGNWSTTINLANGTWRLKAYSFDVAGNRSATSAIRTFHVNATAPDVTPPAPPVVTHPLPNSLNPKWFHFQGTAEAGATVRLFIGSVEHTSTKADANGHWRTGPLTTPYSATFVYDVFARDEAGNQSAATVVPIFVDAVLPEIVIDSGPDRVFLVHEVLMEGRVRDDQQVQSVQVEYYDMRQSRYFAASPATCLATPVANCQGTPTTWARWEHDPNIFFPPGIYYGRAIARDTAGNESDDVERFITIR